MNEERIERIERLLSKTIEEVYVVVNLMSSHYRGNNKSILNGICQNLDNINRELGMGKKTEYESRHGILTKRTRRLIKNE